MKRRPHYIIKVGVERREEIESSEKDKSSLTKRMTLPLACVVSGEIMPAKSG